MTKQGTHFSNLTGRRDVGNTLPSVHLDGQEFIDSDNNRHCIWSEAQSKWFCAAFTTSTSTSTTTTSTSTTTTSTSTTTTSTSTSSTSTSTTTTV